MYVREGLETVSECDIVQSSVLIPLEHSSCLAHGRSSASLDPCSSLGWQGKFGTLQRRESVQRCNCASIALALRTDKAVPCLIRAHPLVGRESLERIRSAKLAKLIRLNPLVGRESLERRCSSELIEIKGS